MTGLSLKLEPAQIKSSFFFFAENFEKLYIYLVALPKSQGLIEIWIPNLHTSSHKIILLSFEDDASYFFDTPLDKVAIKQDK